MSSSEDDHSPTHGLEADSAADVAIVAKGGAIQIAGQAGHRSLAFLFTVLAVRVLGPAGFGLYQVVIQLLEFLSQLGLLGFNQAAMRFVARARVRGDVSAVRGTVRIALASAGIASALVVITVMVGAPAVAGAFGDSSAERDRFALLLRLGVLYVPCFAAMQVLRYTTQAYKTMTPSVVVGNFVQPTLRLLLGGAFLALGMGVSGALAGDVTSMAFSALASIYIYRRILSDEEKRARPRALTGPIVRFALPQSGASLLALQTLGLGVVLLGLRSSNEEAGLFAIALALQGPADITLSGVVNIWAPMVADLHDRGAHGRLDSLFKTVTRWIATGALPVCAALVLEPDLFARILGGERALDAAPVIAIIALGNVFYTCTGPTASLLSMSGRPGVNFLDSVLGVVLYVVLGSIVIPDHGAVGMAWVHSGVTASVNLLRVVQGKLLVGVQPFGASLLKPAGATLVGAATVLLWRSATPDRIPFEVAGLVLGALAYLLVLKLVGVDREERYVWALMKERLFRWRSRE